MLPDASEFRAFFKCLSHHVGARLWLSVALTFCIGALEGSGLLMLLPLMQSIGLGSAASTGKIGQMAVSVLRLCHISPTLPEVLTAFVLLMSAQAVLRICSEVLNARIETSFTCFLRERLYRAMTGSDWLYFTRQRSSDVAQVLMDETQIGSGTQQCLTLLGVLGLALVQILIVFSLSPVLTLTAIAYGAVIAYLLRPLKRRARQLSQISHHKRLEMSSAVYEHLGGMKIAKSLGRDEHHLGQFQRVMHQIADHWVRTVRLNASIRGWLEIGSMLALSLFLYCGLTVLHLKMAALLVIALIFTRLWWQMTTIQDAWQRAVLCLPSFAGLERMRQGFLSAAERTGPAAPEPISLQREICLENLGFSYDPSLRTAALHDIDLIIPARQVLAICGSSGAGKSTLADVLLGLLRPTTGRILIDGQPLTDGRLKTWRHSVGYVPQETFLFHTTIRENLLWAQPAATEADLRTALRTAAAEEFVDRLSGGLDTVIGDRGVRLSGGERQRLALARALLCRPSMLVLDEATSALDTQNERLVQQAIERLHGKLTIVVIAHRLSTVRMADRIMVLENGRAAEIGPWDKLSAREQGAFRQLIVAGTTA